MGFRLTKWYLDCVGADGEAVIAYWARAGWRGVSVAYAGLLRRAAAGEVVTSFTLRPGTEPRIVEGVVSWQCAGLGVRGEWRGGERHRAISRTLLEDSGGRVRWECVAPAAEVEVEQTGAAGTLRGLGYAERIEMTIAPWRLPIRELRWGRWISAERSVVWIDWRGRHPMTLIALDGAEVAGSVADLAVRMEGDTELTLSREGVIRSGRLGATVLGSIPGLRSVLPDAILSTQEDKWIGRGVLRSADGSTDEGWAIHEIVRFGGEGA